MPAVTVMIKPASALCNLRCKYCFYSDVAEHRSTRSFGIMSDPTAEALVKGVFDYADRGVSFVFQGGEPTLAGLSFFRRFGELVSRYNTRSLPVHYSLQTNGTTLDGAWADFFRENNYLIGLSLDGTKEAHDSLRIDAEGRGTYSTVLRSAELLRTHGVNFNILCVVNNFVARYPRRVFENLKKYKYLQFIPCIDPFDGGREIYSLTAERYTRFLIETFFLYRECFERSEPVSVRSFDNYIGMLLGSPAENCAMQGNCSAYFLAEGDGSIYPCDFYVLDRWRLGNVRENSFAEMAQGEVMRRFREESVPVHEKCRSCRYFALCRGGCKRDREPVTCGTPSLNRFCDSYYAFFEYAYPEMLKMAERIARLRSGARKSDKNRQ